VIPAKRQEQTDGEYMRELDTLLVVMQQMVKSEGWQRFSAQLEIECEGAWLRMANAKAVDERALACTEYMVLKRVLEAPGKVMRQASLTMAAAPHERKAGPHRSGQ